MGRIDRTVCSMEPNKSDEAFVRLPCIGSIGCGRGDEGEVSYWTLAFR